jgi:hypothetical protein
MVYKDKNKERESRRNWRLKNKDRINAKRRERSLNDKEYRNEINKKQTEWRNTHLEDYRGYYRNYYRKNHIKVLKRVANWQKEYRKKIKIYLMDILGNKCNKCGIIGSDENICIFEFHHINEENAWGRNNNIRVKTLRKWFDENSIPDDVILLCSNCHKLEHYKPHTETLINNKDIITNDLVN